MSGWVKQAQADRSKGKTGLTTDERAELTRLRKEVRQLEMPRAILKKAAAFFREGDGVKFTPADQVVARGRRMRAVCSALRSVNRSASP